MYRTETCEEEGPHRITNVETTPATTTDVEVTPVMHTHRAARGLLPHEHRLDTGSRAAAHRVTSRLTHAVELVGPVLPDTRWQARCPEGVDVVCCAMDWQAQTVTCPQGHPRRRWTPIRDRQHEGHELMTIQFDPAHCAACPLRPRCTQATTGPRTMKLRPQLQPEALQAARQAQTTEVFQEAYAARAGVEGPLSQGTRAFALRQTRSIGLAKTHLQHLLIATEMNVARVAAWRMGTPRASTRLSAFAALAEAG